MDFIDEASWRPWVAVGLVFLGFFGRWFTRLVLGSWLRRNTLLKNSPVVADVTELLPGPLAFLVNIALWYVAARVIQIPTEPVNLKLFVEQGFQIALAVALNWTAYAGADIGGRAAARYTETTESKLDDQMVPLFRKSVKLTVSVVLLLMVIQNLGYSVSSLLASLGIGGLAIALAARDAMANFFGSIVIFTDRPFQVGDWIVVGDVEGTVEEVGFRTTRVRQFDKAMVTVPNSRFTDSSVVNFSNRSIRRMKFEVGLTYDTSAEQMRMFLSRVNDLLRAHPGLDQTFHFARFVSMGAYALNVQIYAFSTTKDWVTWLETRESLMLQIMELVEESGLAFAFPTQTIVMDDPAPPRGARNAQ